MSSGVRTDRAAAFPAREKQPCREHRRIVATRAPRPLCRLPMSCVIDVYKNPSKSGEFTAGPCHEELAHACPLMCHTLARQVTRTRWRSSHTCWCYCS